MTQSILEIKVLQAGEGKCLIHKDQLEDYNNGIFCGNGKKVYLSATDSKDNYLEMDLQEVEEE